MPPELATRSERPHDGESVAPPFITVLLMASRHREYVGEAIASVLKQTLPRSEFELVIVRDYDDPVLEDARRGLPGRSVRVDPGDIGPAIAAGVRAARGEVLAFLDDDDRFRPQKLATVSRLFREDPGLGFYRNNFSVIDSEGRELMHHPFRAAHRSNASRVGTITLGGPDRIPALRRLPPLGVDFNSSCMSVRRGPLQRFMERLDLHGFRLLDELAFFAVLTSPLSLRFDATPLTEYRLHGRNSSIRPDEPTDPLAGRAAFARLVAPSYVRLREAVRSTGDARATEEASGLQVVQESFLAMREPATPRAAFARLRRDLAGYGSTYMVRSEQGLRSGLGLFSLSPSLGRWLYRRQVRRQSG
ncbi:MAG: glycosyltransferase family 2 protein [Thermoplasmata archaeon]|nr:glycosyltransferase family 2 protein [Thermoplasmata archaeon]